MSDARPKCGNCYFARDPQGEIPPENPPALFCWGIPPQFIKIGERKIPGLRIGAVLEPDRIEPLMQTANPPVKPERPPCGVWQCKFCGVAQVFLDQEHVCSPDDETVTRP